MPKLEEDLKNLTGRNVFFENRQEFSSEHKDLIE